MASMQQIGRALSGFGAGVQGRGPEFIAGLQQQKRLDKQTEEDEDRRQTRALWQDTADAANLINSGNIEGAGDKLIKMSEGMLQQGRSTKEINVIVKAMQDGQNDKALSLLQTEILEGMVEGYGPDTKASREYVGMGARDVDQKQVNALRADIQKVSADFRKVDAAYSRIKTVGKKATGASDLSLIFNFMKINDPGSTVREGEFATAQNSAGVSERVRSTYNQMLKGTRLSPEQREDFLSTAKDLVAGQRDATDRQIGNILEQADQDSIPRIRVFGKTRLLDFDQRKIDRLALAEAPPPGITGPQEITTQAEYDALPSGALYLDEGTELRKP